MEVLLKKNNKREEKFLFRDLLLNVGIYPKTSRREWIFTF